MKKIILFAIISCMITGMQTISAALMEKAGNLPGNSERVIEYDTTGYARLIKVDSFKLAIIPPSSGVQFYKNGIVFLSLTKNEWKMLPDQLSFGAVEAYFAKPEDSVLGVHMIFSPGSSFSYPCESVSFSNDFNTMYFTKFSENDKKEKIYMARFTSQGKKLPGWQARILPLDFCTNNYSYSHPALSKDEDFLIFASDNKGSIGGMDLFISRRMAEKWSPAENLGNLINSKGNEFFPFLDTDNNLFFSSDGLAGYGGYDVFTCKFNGESWDKPINLSGRINSLNDDIAFTINKTDGKTAFYTRRQKKIKGEMQLFRVTLNEQIADSNLLTISNVFNGKPVLWSASTAEKTEAIVKPVEEEPVTHEKPNVIADTPKEVSTASITDNVNNDIVVFKVQFFSSVKSKGKFQIKVIDKLFDTNEYYYKEEYRYTIGEFYTLAQAVELQNTCRKSGYPQAFVVAFKNNIRSLDPKLFK
jgi:hypothetical protein